MKYNTIKNTKVSMLGFGCMRFPLMKDGSIDEIQAEMMVKKAIDHGVTYLDTAYPYHNGKSESFMGRILKQYDRNSFTIATKLPVWLIHSDEDVINIFNEQLERLDMEYFDFYLLHALDKEKWETVKQFHILETIDQLKAEGKIKNFGFSFHDDYETFEMIINAYPFDFCQLQLNYMDMEMQAGMKGVNLCKEKNIPIVVMEPIKGGFLANLPDDVSNLFKEKHPDKTYSSWALRYAGSLPQVKVILSGMSLPEQVDDNLDTFNHFQPLDNEEKEIIEKATKILKAKTRNGCTGCKYCMPCPFGVDIPANFRIWNSMFIYEDEKAFKNRYIKLDKKQARYCKQCGKCESLCPQHIEIRKDLKRVIEDMETAA